MLLPTIVRSTPSASALRRLLVTLPALALIAAVFGTPATAQASHHDRHRSVSSSLVVKKHLLGHGYRLHARPYAHRRAHVYGRSHRATPRYTYRSSRGVRGHHGSFRSSRGLSRGTRSYGSFRGIYRGSRGFRRR